jgi:hypothetical protein
MHRGNHMAGAPTFPSVQQNDRVGLLIDSACIERGATVRSLACGVCISVDARTWELFINDKSYVRPCIQLALKLNRIGCCAQGVILFDLPAEVFVGVSTYGGLGDTVIARFGLPLP